MSIRKVEEQGGWEFAYQISFALSSLISCPTQPVSLLIFHVITYISANWWLFILFFH